MSKFGLLYLHNGMWNDRQVIAPTWVAESTDRHVDFGQSEWRLSYGYFWWRIRLDVGTPLGVELFCALGNYGQAIYVFPELDMIVVFTMGRPSGQGHDEQLDALKRFIIPAALAD